MTEKKKPGFIRRLFGGSHNSCCQVEFEDAGKQEKALTEKDTGSKEKKKQAVKELPPGDSLGNQQCGCDN
ncbi:MAG: hypothetical protein MI863_01620 [Desulfobacterales bacterium]|nr:hypothetical protein [Desulfobacterales bacterium]